MLEGPEVEAHRHHTGHSRLDLIFGALAVFLSCVSVFIALRHGETMERLVAANSWPNLSYDTSDSEPDGTGGFIDFSLQNTGVGPARIETMELFYKDKPVASGPQLMVAISGHGAYNYVSNTIVGDVLPAREKLVFFHMRGDRNRPGVLDTLDKERMHVRVRTCYCSVFDECWIMDTAARRPERTQMCQQSQPIGYNQ